MCHKTQHQQEKQNNITRREGFVRPEIVDFSTTKQATLTIFGLLER